MANNNCLCIYRKIVMIKVYYPSLVTESMTSETSPKQKADMKMSTYDFSSRLHVMLVCMGLAG